MSYSALLIISLILGILSGSCITLIIVRVYLTRIKIKNPINHQTNQILHRVWQLLYSSGKFSTFEELKIREWLRKVVENEGSDFS